MFKNGSKLHEWTLTHLVKAFFSGSSPDSTQRWSAAEKCPHAVEISANDQRLSCRWGRTKWTHRILSGRKEASYFVQLAPRQETSAKREEIKRDISEYVSERTERRTWRHTSAAALVEQVNRRFWSRSVWKNSSTSCRQIHHSFKTTQATVKL